MTTRQSSRTSMADPGPGDRIRVSPVLADPAAADTRASRVRPPRAAPRYWPVSAPAANAGSAAHTTLSEQPATRDKRAGTPKGTGAFSRDF